MKKTLVIILVFFSFLGKSFTQNESFNLTISVLGMKSNEGKVFVAVYNNEASFLNDKKMTKSATIKVNDNTASITFKNLEKGEYAVSVFHDENDNNKMDTKLFGIPKEPYGFSNNSKGFMGPPKFEDSKFLLNKNKAISIIVK